MSHSRTNKKVGTLKTEDQVEINFFELNGFNAVYCYELAGPGLNKISDARVADLNKFAKATLDLYEKSFNP